MSILQIVETSPSRVRGVVRYILSSSSERQKTSALKAMMSPETLPLRRAGRESDEEDGEPVSEVAPGGPRMIDKVLNGCLKLGLVIEEGEDVLLNPDLPAERRSRRHAEALLPLTIADLILAPGGGQNHDLAQLIAWYLLQDPLSQPTTQESLLREIQAHPILHQHFGLKNQSYGQFEDWVEYLGFAWVCITPERRRGITPDPTAFIRRVASDLFVDAEDRTIGAAELVRRLGERCPVLEGGRFRGEVLQMAGLREEDGQLSSASSQAWLRLEEEGYWKLLTRSDAGAPVVITDGDETRQVAAVQLSR
jgi:hypothetical protein